jgi:6-hydroxycyclohex-1-ene-1-carbonyl-CoA dehydrogenase
MSEPAYRWQMTAADKPLEKIDLRLDDPPPPGEVVVAIAGCGVCHTDLGYYYDGVRTNQPLPLTLGHEISGHVVAAGDGVGQWVGRAVIIPAVIPCGECELCKRGRATICPNQKMPGNDIEGGFASHITVPARGLCAVDESRLKAAGLTLADVSVVADAMTTPYQAVLQADVKPGSLTVVVGAGGVGGYAVQIAAAFGATVVALDVDQAKLDTIAEYGAQHTINVREVQGRDLRRAVQEFAAAKGLPSYEWNIFECSGTTAGQTTAFGLLNRGATLGVVGFTMDRVEIRLSNLMAYHARALGNWGCPPELYPDAVELVLDGRVKVAPFVEQHPLDDINAVFEAVHAGKLARRAVLVPNA